MIAFIDCFCGVAGDMVLGALVDAGASLPQIRKELKKLPVEGYTIRRTRVMRGPFSCTKVNVSLRKPRHHHKHGHHHHHASARGILSMIRKSDLAPRVKKRATDIFLLLAEAEGRMHGCDPQKVHFHEVGAVDSIVDIVGAAIALELLDIDDLHCSAIAVSSGTVESQHGRIPVPAPATTELLQGFPLIGTDIREEIVTPTGAAILAALVKEPGRFPDMKLEGSGTGAGGHDIPERPDFLRILVGKPIQRNAPETALLIETNIDDQPGEEIGDLFELLLEAGALDVYTTPIQMKKSRPGVRLSLLAPPHLCESLEEIVLHHSSTFGVRRQWVERTVLDREIRKVRTPYGSIRVKTGMRKGKVLKQIPEYEDLRKAARKHGVPVRTVRAALHRALDS